jgi:hypothetical protein
MDITSYLLGKNSAGGGGGGSDLDWTALGYAKRPQAIDEAYNYAKQIKNNWVPATSLSEKFRDYYNLYFMPLVDTSITTNFNNMFRNCNQLTTIPVLDLSQATSFNYMFHECTHLSDESLNNILQMAINTTSFTGAKYLTQFGFSSTNYPATRIQALPSYQAFLDAGWTIGY